MISANKSTQPEPPDGTGAGASPRPPRPEDEPLRKRPRWLRWSAPDGHSRDLSVRFTALVFVWAWVSLWTQIPGLIGSDGILPIAGTLDAYREYFVSSEPPLAPFWNLPTILWLDASDAALHFWACVGVCAALVASSGRMSAPLLFGSGYLYLSLTLGTPFFAFQWDVLLVETAVICLLLGSWRVGPTPTRPERAPWFIQLLPRLLVFRLMLASGLVKLASNDPAWADWSALEYHYFTQPLPSPTSRFAHHLPDWLHWLSCGAMFAIELVVPFFIFGPNPIRRLAIWLLVLLQLAIMATGNFGFFNWLTIGLCLMCADDEMLPQGFRQWLEDRRRARRFSPRTEENEEDGDPQADFTMTGEEDPRPQVSEALRRLSVGALATASLAWASVGVFGLAIQFERVDPDAPPALLRPHQSALESARRFRSIGSYGLFADMTESRPEITLYASADGVEWEPYEFRFKPGDPSRPPRFAFFGMPRLDWQFWFAALAADCRNTPWFFDLVWALAEEREPVQALFADLPLEGERPAFIYASVSLYEFSDPQQRRDSGNVWQVTAIDSFCPPLGIGDDGVYDASDLVTLPTEPLWSRD